MACLLDDGGPIQPQALGRLHARQDFVDVRHLLEVRGWVNDRHRMATRQLDRSRAAGEVAADDGDALAFFGHAFPGSVSVRSAVLRWHSVALQSGADQRVQTSLGEARLAGGGASPMCPTLTKPARDSRGCSPSARCRTSSAQRSPLKTQAPYPNRCAAFRRLPSAAPAASHCSDSRADDDAFGETTKTSSTGGLVACSRARARSSEVAAGSRRNFSSSKS